MRLPSPPLYPAETAGHHARQVRRVPRPRPEVTLDQLHTFLAVAERQHIGEAAAALGISQGSVSMVVHRLERSLGLPLFQRVGRNIRLTDIGHALRPLATRVFDDMAHIDELRSSYMNNERGEIAIAAGYVVGARRVPGWLAGFVATHPEINLHLTLAPFRVMIAMLLEGEVDLMFAGAGVDVPGVESMTMEHTEMVLVVAAGHPLARSRAPLRQLNRYRHLEHEQGTATRRLAAQLLGEHGEEAEGIQLEEGALSAALIAGLGFAVMPRALVEPDLAAGRLVLIACPGPAVAQRFSAARRDSGHTPALDLLWDHLRQLTEHP